MSQKNQDRDGTVAIAEKYLGLIIYLKVSR